MPEGLGPLSWIIVGLIAGAAAGFLVPGRERFGCIGTTLIGIVGGFIGGWIWTNLLGMDEATGFLGALFVAIIGAVIVLLIWTRVGGRRTAHV